MFYPEDINRDRWGFWCHSVIAKLDEDESITEMPEAEGMEFFFIGFDDDASDELKKIYEKGSQIGADVDWSEAVKQWNPSMPAGEGWFLAAIYDTEDGPYACYARPKASVLGSSEWLDEKLKAKGN